MPGSIGPSDGHSGSAGGSAVAVVVGVAGARVLDGNGLLVVDGFCPIGVEQAANARTAATSPMFRSFLCSMIEKA